MSLKNSTPKSSATFKERLRRLRWLFVRENPTSHEQDVQTVLGALARGDESLARRLAEIVEKHDQSLAKASDIEVRQFWFETLGQWDGFEPSPNDMALAFVRDMAYGLKIPEHVPPGCEGQHVQMLDTNEHVEAVRIAFERTMATAFYTRSPGRSLLSAGLRAMGIDDPSNMLSNFDPRKRNRQRER